MTVNLPEESPRQAAFRRFVNELVAIADRFGVNLIMPGELVKKDYETIALLKRYIESGAEEANQISVVLTKSKENKDLLPQLIASGRASFRITHPNVNPVPTLFGTVIDTGPVMEEFEVGR
jgi:hypothetical protein